MTTSDKIAAIAASISVFTLLFSFYYFKKTDTLSKTAFNRNYRPYLVAASFSYIDKNQILTPLMHVVNIKVYNAPAFVISKKMWYYIRDENNNDSLLFEQPEYKNELLYPIESTQYTMYTNQEIINPTLANSLLPKTIIRKVKIEYQWISDNSLKYFFYSEWKYNVKGKDWEIISQEAN